MAKIDIENITQRFVLPGKKELTAVKDINLAIAEGELLVILGKSGCGKSTLLKLIAGLLKPSEGAIRIDNQLVTAPHHSRMMMFQEPCLLPWLTVEDNMAFGCSLRKEKNDIAKKVKEWIRIIGLEGFEKVYPGALSAGMLQRASLAGSLIGNPDILLMDEAFSDVDYFTRIHLMELLIHLWKKLNLTLVLVTHDLDEALLLGQRIIIMGDRPGTIKHIFNMDFPYPRDIRDPRLHTRKIEFMEALKQFAAGLIAAWMTE